MKKILLILLTVILACSALFAFTACEEEVEPAKRAQQLAHATKNMDKITIDVRIDNSVNMDIEIPDFGFGDIGMGDIDMGDIIVPNGNVNSVILVKGCMEIREGKINADLAAYYTGSSAQYGNLLLVALVRDNVAYYGSFANTAGVTENNWESYVRRHLSTVSFTALGDLEELAGGVIEDFLGGYIGEITAENIMENIGEEESEMIQDALAKVLALVFNESSSSMNSTTMSVNLQKHIDKLFDKATALITLVKESSDITISELYSSEEFTDWLLPVFDMISAQEVYDALRIAEAEATPDGGSLPITIYVPDEEETSYEYIGRYLNTRISGVTVGALRVSDLLELAFGQMGMTAAQLYDYALNMLNTYKDTVAQLLEQYLPDYELSLTLENDEFSELKLAVKMGMDMGYMSLDYDVSAVIAATDSVTLLEGAVLPR